jgi:hypothetical protein
MLAVAQLSRGIDIGLGIEALANIEGSIRQYLAADVQGRAHAAARVRGQVQIPLDLFDESGVAVRLQAVAEAAAGVELAIGLSVADFMALAAQDERMRGAPLELLKVFLDEFSIQGGVMAKAAAAAMAYANVVATGSLVKKGQRKPGFIVAAEAGVGLKAGAGFRVYARFGVDDPRRLIRRSVDVAVRETLTALAPTLPGDSAAPLDELAVALRIAFRSAFEIGEELASARGSASTLALRAVQVVLEELQRHVFEAAVRFASAQLRTALASLAFDDATWRSTEPQRQALSTRLLGLPEDWFEATDANRAYWSGLITDVLGLASALQPGHTSASVVESVAITWCCTQLLMRSVERISVAQARASVIGAPAVGTTAAFAGNLPAAPTAVRTHVNAALGRGRSTALDESAAVQYLLNSLGYRIELVLPGSTGLLSMLTGKGRLEEALSVVLSNLGAFAPAADGNASADASLAVLQQGLQVYIDGRLRDEVLPLIERQTAGQPALRTYLDEVLLGTLRTMVGTVLTELPSVSRGGSLERALREMCSALLMRLLGRSLVVAADVLAAHAQARLQDEFRAWSRQANDAGGAVDVLAALTGLQRQLVSDLVVETLEVCADTFAPMPAARRARIRDLLYQMIDTMPPVAGRDALESLKSAAMIGNVEAALELAQLLGEDIASNLVRFIQALLAHAAEALLTMLADTIEDAQRAVESWIAELEGLGRDLGAALEAFRAEIARLERQIDSAADAVFEQLSVLLGGFSAHEGSRTALRGRIKDSFVNTALDALADVPGYGSLPVAVRRGVRSSVRSMVNAALDASCFDEVVGALQTASGEVAELLDDVRRMEPGDDLTRAIADLALDRIEAALRATLRRTLSLNVAFEAPILGRIDLGRISVDLDALVQTLRSAVRDLGRFHDAVNEAASRLEELLTLEGSHAETVRARDAAQALKAESERHLEETASVHGDMDIVSPVTGANVGSSLTVSVRLSSVSDDVLNDSGLSQRRLYVWANGSDVEVATARVRLAAPSERPVAGRSGAPAIVLQPQGEFAAGPSSRPALPATARLQRHAGERNAAASRRFAMPASVSGAGVGVLPRPFPGLPHARPDEATSALDVEIDVPAGLLHEGVNVVACVYVPGPRQRRIERTVSFLVKPRRKPRKGARTMPHRPPPSGLRLVADEVLKNAPTPRSARRGDRDAPTKLERATWSPPREVTLQRVERSREVLNGRVRDAVNRLQEVRKAVAQEARRARDSVEAADAADGPWEGR